MAEITVLYEGLIVTRADAKAAGLKRYFTGRPCCRGHIAQRKLRSGDCLACVAVRNKTDHYKHVRHEYDKTPNARRLQREYDSRRAEARREYEKSDHVRAVRRAYHSSPRAKAAAKLYRKTARGALAVRNYDKTERRKAAKLSYQRSRRAIKRGAGKGSFTQENEARLRNRQKNCYICGKRFTKDNPATIDHIIPVSKGGIHDVTNIVLAHHSCNAQKSNKILQLI